MKYVIALCVALSLVTSSLAAEPKEKTIWEKELKAEGRTPPCPICGQRDQVTPGQPQPDGTLNNARECYRCHYKFTAPLEPLAPGDEGKRIVVRLTTEAEELTAPEASAQVPTEDVRCRRGRARFMLLGRSRGGCSSGGCSRGGCAGGSCR